MSSSDESVQEKPVRTKKSVKVVDKEVVLTKAPPRKRRPLNEAELEKLGQNRIKALAALTEMRRKKALDKEKVIQEEKVIKEEIEVVKLNKAPKVKELDDSFTLMKNEIEALKKQLSAPVPAPARKVKRVIYESDEEKPVKSSLTGNELLDALFFTK